MDSGTITSNTITYNTGAISQSVSYWIRNRNWDLTFISLSAVLVFVPLASFYFGQSEKSAGYAQYMSKVVDYFVAACIGGPHMFSTVIRTIFNKRFVYDDKFLIDGRILLFPPFLKQEWLIYVTFAVFFLAVAIFVYKTFLEIKENRFNGPKTLLISLTFMIGFWIPSVGLIGIPLDVSFQG